MNEKKNNRTIIPIETSTGLGALAQAKVLIKTTQDILDARKAALAIDASWIDELIAWANEHNISEEQFPRDRKEIVNLAALDLLGNRLTKLPESIGQLSNLTELHLRGNSLTELPESIGQIHNLTTLDLGYNNLN